MQRVINIRETLKIRLEEQEFVIDKSGVKTVEIVGAQFLADEDSIFGTVDWNYVEREIAWYSSMSLDVNDIPGGPPTIWELVSSRDGLINSNYGWCIWSEDNCRQFEHCLEELARNPFSRRAIMIYTRPTMWYDYNADGMSDFMCTNTVQYFIRDNKLITRVDMRSNDAVFGYKNDRAWADYVRNLLLKDLQKFYPDLELGDLIWCVGSLHVYERHFPLMLKDA